MMASPWHNGDLENGNESNDIESSCGYNPDTNQYGIMSPKHIRAIIKNSIVLAAYRRISAPFTVIIGHPL
jgi:hypothetical protein